ncbi:MAG: Fe-S-oxidoreductase [Desulfotalea sp.]|nr:MAG: Fe-S-oxidoreductase [Desulfotalea sp.]
MLKIPTVAANVDDLATWSKYKKKMCDYCKGTCCSLPVEVKPVDLVRMGAIDAFELEENMKGIFKRLSKQKIVEHFHAKTTTFTLARMANGDCLYLDSSSRRCSIYEKRPDTCRNHPRIGPRAGYCAFIAKKP